MMMLARVVRMYDTWEAECQLRRRCVPVPSPLGVRVPAEVYREIPTVCRGWLQSGQTRMRRSPCPDRCRQMAAEQMLQQIRDLDMRQPYVCMRHSHFYTVFHKRETPHSWWHLCQILTDFRFFSLADFTINFSKTVIKNITTLCIRCACLTSTWLQIYWRIWE